MTVYVDEAIFPGRAGLPGGKRGLWCHLWADTLEELHAFALALGQKRAWFQGPPRASWDHYDLTEGKRWQALRRGAVATDRYGPQEFLARQRGDDAALARIAEARARVAAKRVAA